jgi:hypothetical protein
MYETCKFQYSFNVICKYLTFFRLSERNCIEVVTKLLDLKLLDVVFTTDGKEYVTPQQLTREIRDELYVHAGSTFQHKYYSMYCTGYVGCKTATI